MVEERLKSHDAQYKMMEHEPEGNCEKVSALRGNPVHAAAKALLVNVKMSAKHGKYVLVNIPGDKQLDLDAIKAKYKARSVAMAEKTKVEELLSCEIGRVPPFSFNDSVQVLIDEELIRDNEKVYFSPGRLDRSVEINAQAFRDIIVKHNGEVAVISKQSAYKGAAPLFAASQAKPAEEPAVTASLSNSNIK
jgi:Ala-tRNA(Pro) deacylase